MAVRTPLLWKIYYGAIFVSTTITLVHNQSDVNNLFVVVMSVTFFCTMRVLTLPVYLRVARSDLSQYNDILQQAVVVNGKITFCGKSTPQDDTFRVEGEIRYRIKIKGVIQEITKLTVTTRRYEPKEGDVESVKLLILPSYPNSGIEPCHVRNEKLRIEKDLKRRWLYLFSCSFLAISLWPWTIRIARNEERLHHVYATLAFVVLMSLNCMVVIALKIKLQSVLFYLMMIAMLCLGIPAHIDILFVRMGASTPFWRFGPPIAYATALLFVIAIYLLKPTPKDILDPRDNVTVSNVCDNDYDPVLAPLCIGGDVEQPLLGGVTAF